MMVDHIQTDSNILSLQDTCKLDVLKHIDEFPLDLLAKLPTSIRHKLWLALSVFDRLHYEDTYFVNGFNEVHVLIPQASIEISLDPSTTIMCSQQVVSSTTLKDKLISYLFAPVSSREVIRCSVINFHEAIQSFDYLSRNSASSSMADNLASFVKCMTPMYNGFCPVYSSGGYNDLFSPNFISYDQPGPSNTVFFPRRHSQFVTLVNRANDTNDLSCDQLKLMNVKQFINYCKLIRAPKELKIDTLYFQNSALWTDYVAIRKKAIEESENVEKNGSNHNHPLPTRCIVNPILPHFQELLSSVEILELDTPEDPDEYTDCNIACCCIDVPYFILANITSNKSSVLKSIKIDGVLDGAIQTLLTIAGFLCGKGYDMSLYHAVQNDLVYTLQDPSDDPYLIESLSFSVDSKINVISLFNLGHPRSMTLSDCELVSQTLKQIVEKQMNNLRNLSIYASVGIIYEKTCSYRFDLSESDSESEVEPYKFVAFSTEDYISLLTSTFVDFVKRPQFCSLRLDESPEKYCYSLVDTFLSKPVSNEQKLSIAVVETGTLISFQPPSSSLNHQKFPVTNYKFKSLGLGPCDCGISRSIANLLPHIELKKLHMPAACLANSLDHCPKISHVSIDFSEMKKIFLKSWRLNLPLPLISNNSSLSVLTAIEDFSSTPCPLLFPTIVASLKTVLDNRTAPVLKEVKLINIEFGSYAEFERLSSSHLDELQSDNNSSTKYVALKDMNDSPTEAPSKKRKICQSNESSCCSSYDYNEDIFRFFVLIQKLQVTLYLFGIDCPFKFKLFSQLQENNLIMALANEFKEKKIKKIIIGREYEKDKDTLKELAETVVIDDPAYVLDILDVKRS